MLNEIPMTTVPFLLEDCCQMLHHEGRNDDSTKHSFLYPSSPQGCVAIYSTQSGWPHTRIGFYATLLEASTERMLAFMGKYQKRKVNAMASEARQSGRRPAITSKAGIQAKHVITALVLKIDIGLPPWNGFYIGRDDRQSLWWEGDDLEYINIEPEFAGGDE